MQIFIVNRCLVNSSLKLLNMLVPGSGKSERVVNKILGFLDFS